MKQHRYILAVDQGTSATKAVIFNLRGEIAAKASAPLASRYPRPGFVEQDPDEILASVTGAVRLCLKQFVKTTKQPAESIAACGISNQRETFVLWDKSGAPLAPAVVWQCKRSIGICEQLKKEGMAPAISKRTGLIIDPYFSGTKTAWLAKNNGKVRSALRNGRALFGTVDSWLLYKLTGGASYCTDYTNACRTLFFNINILRWDSGLLKSFGLSGLQLPRPLPSSAAFGETDFSGLFKRPIPVTAMIGDSHAAAFGQGCFTPGSAKVTMGTGSSILMNTGAKRAVSKNGMMSTICWSSGDRVDYAFEGIIVSCGSTLTWLRDGLGLYSTIDELNAMAASVRSSDGVCLVPAFSGLGAPHWKMDARAQLTGMTFGTTKNHIARAGLESVCHQVTDVLGAMKADMGRPLARIMADGGISKNPFVMQTIADLTGVQVVQRGIEEASALGAALLAGLGAGLYRTIEELTKLPVKPAVYKPRKNCAGAQAAYRGWLDAVGNVKAPADRD